MKCGIVTVYNSENCGSFLQAFALSKAIEKTGHEAVFVRQNFSDHSASRKNYLKLIIKSTLKGRFAKAKRLAERRSIFKQACECFKIVELSEYPPCCVLGSDVIWDFTEPFFKNHRSFFWGTQFKNAKVISYAPSVGFAKKENFENSDFVGEALKKMNSVSVRDNTSKQILQDYCSKEIQVVCDPTYLIDRSEYDAIAKATDLSDFLFLYYYGEVPTEYKDAIQSLAKKEGLTTVTFGNFNSWCDIQLSYDPLLFLSIYDKAAYIITNTFHGTVFATIYEKRFAVIKNDKPKILNVLEMCAMSEKMTQSPEDIFEILHSEFHYEITRQSILEERKKGLQFLKTAIED